MLNKNFRMIHSPAFQNMGSGSGSPRELFILPSSIEPNVLAAARAIFNPQNKRLVNVGTLTDTEHFESVNVSRNYPYENVESSSFSLYQKVISGDATYSASSTADINYFIIINDGQKTFCTDQPNELTTTDKIKSSNGDIHRTALLILGSGTTPPTEDDYKLENCNLKYKLLSCASTINFLDSKVSVTLTIQCIEDGIVNEIGLYTFQKGDVTAFSQNLCRMCMIGRKVLNTPVQIEAGKTYSFTYNVDLMLMNDL